MIDETGMVATRTLDAIVAHMAADTKLVLIGDDHQLPEIGAGGVLRGLAERFEDLPRLMTNVRQRDVAEREALNDLRHGDVNRGIDWYQRAGRVEIAEDAPAARAALIERWWADRELGGEQLVMAERRRDVERLNLLARARFETAGLRGTRRLIAADRDFATGDRVVFGRNDRLLGVRNGERGTVANVTSNALVIDVHSDNGDRRVTVGGEYLQAGHVDYGWATTVHKNQGATCERAYLLATDTLYRELGYVALSRGRTDNRVWVIGELEPDITSEGPHAPEPDRDDPLAKLVNAMQRSTAQQLALDQMLDPDATTRRAVATADLARAPEADIG